VQTFPRGLQNVQRMHKIVRAEAGNYVARWFSDDIVAEVLREFDEPIAHPSGTYHARVLGRLAEDGRWEGWLEFVPLEPGKPVAVSPVESRQSQREYLEYWAQGLSVVYAEGALDRALHPLAMRPRVTGPPLSERPAPRPVTPPVRLVPEPVLDPFEVGRRNLDILRQELHALDRPRLLNIITAFDLNPASKDVAPLSDEQLVTFIVVAVEAQMVHRAR
jgi:hypothetical protein